MTDLDPTRFRDLPEPIPTEVVRVVKETEHWVVAVMPMLFNDRIVLMTHQQCQAQTFLTAGWCYDKGPAAALAALAWDPETEPRPVGYKKEAFDGR